MKELYVGVLSPSRTISACPLALCQTSSDLTEAKAQQGFYLDPLAPVGRSELTSSLSGSPCLEQTLALMHFERGSECRTD